MRSFRTLFRTRRRRTISDRPGPEPDPKPLQTLTLVEWSSVDAGADSRPRLTFGSYDQRYRTEDFVGEGGMGEVFRGRDTSLRRDIAIKYLKVERAEDPRSLGQFWHEAVNSGVKGTVLPL